MTREPFVVDTDALHAFADGQLGDAERATVERYLAANPDALAMVTSWQRQNETLLALFSPTAHEPVPPRLNPARVAQRLRTERQHSLRNVAAALVLVLLGGGIGWYGRDYLVPTQAASDRLIAEAVTAHELYVKEKTHAVEAGADSPNLMRWLSNRIATPIDAPNLTEQGFTFIGARLLPGSADGSTPGPAAQLMYENASAERVTLYITAALPGGKNVWSFKTQDGVKADYWANDAVTCTIVSNLADEEVRMLGKKIFEQLTRRPDSSWNPAG